MVILKIFISLRIHLSANNFNYTNMKHLSIIISLNLITLLTFAQQQNNAIDFKWDWSRSGDGKSVTINANNRDYCDYYVSLSFKGQTNYTARGSYKGKTARASATSPIVTLVRNNNSGGNGGFNYQIYRGNIHDKVNPNFIYALPIKEADSLRFSPSKKQIFESRLTIKSSCDTIFACREGRVCDNDLTDTSAYGSKVKERIIIIHKDGSFGEYGHYTKRLVFPGQYVKIGQPIAISAPSDKGFIRVSFSVYFLDKNKVNDPESALKHSGIIPIFHTANQGNTKLEENTTYIGTTLSDEVIMQDMSKKEQQKYLKQK